MLLNTGWNVPLDWVEDWWPVAPMLFGAYLVWRWAVDRREATSASAGAATSGGE